MTFSVPDLGLLNVLPILILVAWACMLLLVDLILPASRKYLTPLLAALGLVVAIIFTIPQFGNQREAFNGMLVIDGFAVFLNILVLVSGLVAIAISTDYLKRMDIARGEYYTMMLFSISGVMLMASAADLIVVFLALELFSIPLYIMAAFAIPKESSEEAGLKYFVLGAFSGGFILYGIALVYGATGATALSSIAAATDSAAFQPMFFLVGAALILVGLGFKVAIVPFHMWTPDVYQGSPSPSTAFMAVIAKVGGFAALLRVFILAFPSISADLTPVIWTLAAATLIVGNVLAIAQTNIKRLLAYSSISHAGFIFMAFITYGDDSVFRDTTASILFYLLAFAITSFGAWAVVMSLEHKEDKGLDLEDYAGLGRKYPALALAMAIFMFSFTGVPPTIGFAGKLFLFRTVIDGGYIGLAVLAVFTSLISAYYYLRLVIIMYMRAGVPKVHNDSWLRLTYITAALATIALFLFSEPIFSWAAQSVLRGF
ncbi:MAG: NADH-quinone oxidoreductase subunit N [Chloroflexi bacterium]|nr:NADH-quinone oxidoreductase subunit N [Chloroflexota bacterium]